MPRNFIGHLDAIIACLEAIELPFIGIAAGLQIGICKHFLGSAYGGVGGVIATLGTITLIKVSV